MAEIKWDDIVNKVGEKIVNEYIYKDKPLREWIDLIVDYEPNRADKAVLNTTCIVPNIGRVLNGLDPIESNGSQGPNKAKEAFWFASDSWPHNIYCSNCYTKYAQEHWEIWKDGSLPRKYCPNCGAKMAKKVER